MAILGSTTLTGCSSIPSFIAADTKMLFQQSSAPTSWTKVTDSNYNNIGLRIVTGNTDVRGSVNFTDVFSNKTISSEEVSVSGSVGDHTLDLTQIPSHAHGRGSVDTAPDVSPAYPFANAGTRSSQASTGASGGDQAHSHPWSGSGSFSTTLDLRLKYVDLILAAKD